MSNRTLIKNAKILTMTERKTADWLVIEDDHITAVGGSDKYLKYTDNSCNVEIIDANGASVVPGFIDSHFHVIGTAMSREWINFSDSRSFDDIREKIQLVQKQGNRKAIIGAGLDSNKLTEARLPDRKDLDEICSDIPVAIYSQDYHILMLNTHGILYYKAPFTLSGVELDESGMPTGIFSKKSGAKLDITITNSIPDESIENSIKNLVPELASLGLTTIAAMEGGNMNYDYDSYKDAQLLLKNQKSYPVDFVVYYQTTEISLVKRLGLKQIGGTIYLDGTLGAHTAALSEPYTDMPNKKGMLLIDQDELNSFVCDCMQNDLQVSLDAIGDCAVESALIAFEYAQGLYGKKDTRSRIEHAVLVTEEQMKRANRLGVVLSMQPSYEGHWGGPDGMYAQRLGARWRKTNAFRDIIDHGVQTCAGSDSDVTDPNPMKGIHWAVNHPNKDQRISVYEAVKMYTKSGAYGLFMEDKKGSIAPGLKADIVILDSDIENISPMELKNVKVKTTIKNGDIIFDERK